MRPRWLLLAVSVICLLVLAPAAALSQGATLNADCGTATIDGWVGPVEWANAATLALYAEERNAHDTEGLENPPSGAVGPSQDGEVYETGTAYFMHDETFLYVGVVLEDVEDNVPDDTTDFDLWMAFAFEDEPAGMPGRWTDCLWEADICEESGEGHFMGSKERDGDWTDLDLNFIPWVAEHEQCEGEYGPEGVTYEAVHRGTAAHYEMRVNLETSALDNVETGDCFDLRWLWAYEEADEEGPWMGWIEGFYPVDQVDNEPFDGECTVLCLDPCAAEEPVEEEFVPEPGTMLLLGSGLAGLAGYATLRWRTKE